MSTCVTINDNAPASGVIWSPDWRFEDIVTPLVRVRAVATPVTATGEIVLYPDGSIKRFTSTGGSNPDRADIWYSGTGLDPSRYEISFAGTMTTTIHSGQDAAHTGGSCPNSDNVSTPVDMSWQPMTTPFSLKLEAVSAPTVACPYYNILKRLSGQVKLREVGGTDPSKVLAFDAVFLSEATTDPN